MKNLATLLKETEKVYHQTTVRGVIYTSYYDEKLEEWVDAPPKNVRYAKAVTEYWTEYNGKKIYIDLPLLKQEVSDEWEYYLYNDSLAFSNWCAKHGISQIKF